MIAVNRMMKAGLKLQKQKQMLGKRRDGSQWMRIRFSGRRTSFFHSLETLLASMRLSESDVTYDVTSEVDTKLKIHW